MNMKEYQDKARVTAQYPQEQGVVYTSLVLVGEAGEIANKVKKTIRGDKPIEAVRSDLMAELGDVLWYVAMLAHELGYTLEEVAQANLDKLSKRHHSGTIQGDGDNR